MAALEAVLKRRRAMTGRGPARALYARLEPEERFRLTLAALARGDDDELERLEQTCPRRLYEMADRAVGDLTHASREAALFFTIIFGFLLRHADLAWTRIQLMNAFLDGYEQCFSGALDVRRDSMGMHEEAEASTGDNTDAEDGADSSWRDGVTADVRVAATSLARISHS